MKTTSRLPFPWYPSVPEPTGSREPRRRYPRDTRSMAITDLIPVFGGDEGPRS